MLIKTQEEYSLASPQNEQDWQDYHDIRRIVLFEARGRFNIYSPDHPDEYKQGNHPLLLKREGRSIGTVRLDERDEGAGVVRLVAITQNEQGNGSGRVLDRLVMQVAHDLGMKILYVNAEPTAHGYYQKTGWQDYDWDAAEAASANGDVIQMKKDVKVEW